MKRIGVCKLTRQSGKFVRSHLIPLAVTKPTATGAFFISGGDGTKPKRNWTSWYDLELVTREGEAILAEYDDWAIGELRRSKLVWSSWGSEMSLPAENWKGTFPKGYGLRRVPCADPHKFRLFFLSLLWRAAATSLPEFHAVSLSGDDLERLRFMVVNGDPYPLDFFPVRLLQIITRGFDHNLTPVAVDFGPARVGTEVPVSMRMFRFYFDGLVIHFHRDDGLKIIELLPTNMIGDSSELWVQTQTFEDSFQRRNMLQHVVEGTQRWSSVIGGMLGKSTPNKEPGSSLW